jgi:peptide-methionine (S)-S-oxide reductase
MASNSHTSSSVLDTGRRMRTKLMLALAAVIVVVAMVRSSSGGPAPAAPPASGGLAKATFAGGCFWSMELPWKSLKGVVSVTAGYTGGSKASPTYEEVSAGGTGHLESVEVTYDPKQIGYPQLLDVFWHNIDPTNRDGQFCDYGSQYRTAIFVHDPEQQRLAAASKGELSKRMKIFTEIRPAVAFFPAEEYHQNYPAKNPIRYKLYRMNCGRDRRLEQLWGAAPRHE